MLALVLGAVTTVLLLLALSTSAAAFGAFNPFWEGSSQLQQVGEQVGSDTVIIRNTTQYGSTSPNRTIALVLSPDATYGSNASRRVDQFVRRGGTLVVAEDFGENSDRLLGAIGASARFNGSLLRDQRYNHRTSALPVVTNITNTSITAGVQNLTLNHGTIVQPNGATVLARSSEFSYLDLNRNGAIDETETPQSYPVVTVEEHGDGRIILVSDPSAFINLMLDRPGNNRLVRNLFGAHRTVLLDFSNAASLPPLAVAVLILRGQPALQIGLGLLGLVVVWSRFHETSVSWPDLGRNQPTQVSAPTLSADEVEVYLARRHPEWDRDRIRRVTEEVMHRRQISSDDE